MAIKFASALDVLNKKAQKEEIGGVTIHKEKDLPNICAKDFAAVIDIVAENTAAMWLFQSR